MSAASSVPTGTTSLVYVGLVAVLARPLGPLALPVASLGNTTIWLRRFRTIFRSIFGPTDDAPASVAAPMWRTPELASAQLRPSSEGSLSGLTSADATVRRSRSA